MEFFEFANVLTTEAALRENLIINALPLYCEAVEAVDEAEEPGRVIYFRHWGRFHIKREEVMGGVRFFVPDCPNALAWTITTGYPPHPEIIVLHTTINRTEHDPDFIFATRELLTSLKSGLKKNAKSESINAAPHPVQITDLRDRR